MKFYVIVLFFLVQNCFCQNLVPNHSFESSSSCPPSTGNGQFGLVDHWQKPPNHGGSPDYYNACSNPGSLGVPNNGYGYESAASGDAYIGFTLYYNGPWNNFREYAQVQLTSPLLAGVSYSVSLKYSVCEESSHSSNHLGIFFSNGVLSGANSVANLPVQPQISWQGPFVDTSGWTILSEVYVATGGEDYITIGSFVDDITVILAPIGWTNTTGFTMSYVYIDDVSVIPHQCNVDLGNDTLVCHHQSLELNATSPNCIYTWQDGSTDSTYQVTQSGTYYVEITDTTIGCSASDTIEVTLGTPPLVNAGVDQTICQGMPATLTGSGAPNLNWDNGVIDGVPFTPNATNTYVLTGTSVDGCINTDTVAVAVTPGISVNLGQDVLDCTGGTITLDALNPGSTYLWSDNSTNQSLDITQSGTYYVEVTSGGCSATDTIEVVIGTPPVVDAGPDQTICQGMPVTLTGSGAPTLNWDNGVVDGTPFTPANTTTYNLTGTSVEGCTSTDMVTVTVNPLPVPIITGNLDYCEGETTSLMATTGYTSYSWSNGVTTPTNANLTVLNNPVAVTVTDGNGCSGTSATATLVEHTNPIVDLGPDAQICAGGAVQLDAQNPGASYLWSTGEITPTITVNTLGSYHVAVTTTVGCMGYDTANVNVGAPPVLDAGPDQTICRGEEVILAGTGNGVFMWSNNVQDNVPFAPTQTTNYTLTMIDANNCTNTDEVLITVEELPEASFVYVPHELDITTPEVTFTNTTINGDTYQWTFGEGGTSTEEHPVYEYQQIGTYQVVLIAISDYGCVDTAYATLEVKDVPYFYVPNSFSPNGDGINEVFYPVLSGRMPTQYELLIFNRWGEVIFQTNTPNQGWDGTYQGTPCQIDNYVWVVTMVDGGGVEIKDFRGHVSLVR